MTTISNNAILWAACSAGRTKYGHQMIKNADIKKQTLESVLIEKFPDYLSFGNDLKSMASYLCDSKRFLQECVDLELQPEVVAQHVVFGGSKTFNKVRNYGIKAVFGTQTQEFNKPLITE